ncbi:beta-galactosidase [Exiguobacterium sp. LL15]|uniref:beta-galactosidase n=1 Tax=Exiguobacterium sp. LL15 TaxID=2950547 RepID=UPI00210AFE8E|nr:beta-galactosidase [Exiguobacterium sp. LL15]MCQ4091464.1 beta-galactosidase [Exiguobacterium sp. LL15]
MYLGVDYYPEQTPRALWEEDFRLMKELGVNVVRLAEFAWSMMEPEEGVYDFSFWDDVIERLSAEGFDIVLGTPTATPPAWLCTKYPEILPVDENGVTISFGARRHYTVHSETYQRLSVKITEEMAKRYGQHPRVIGWQTDNEYGHEKSDRSYGDVDRAAFQRWLENRYGTLDALNEAWGTVFWSQTYTAWEQIPVPRKVYQEHNPSLLVDFDRFCADGYTYYNKLQVDVLRRYIPENVFITHNLVYSDMAVNQQQMAQDLDYVAFDNYPVWGGLPEPNRFEKMASDHDLCRSSKQGKGFWVMEQLSGAQGWSKIGYLPRPGHIRLWTYQAVARGAEAIVYFRFRAAHFGTEEFCHGIIDHDGKPKRKFEEVKQIMTELNTYGDEINASRYDAKVGVYFDQENVWAWTHQPHSDAFDFRTEFVRFYGGAVRQQVATDIVFPGDDLSSYKLIIVPLYFLTNPTFDDALIAYMEQGGHVIFTYRTGVKDARNHVVPTTLPGKFAPYAGIEIDEYESLQSVQQHQVAGIGEMAGQSSTARLWCDLITPTTAETLAVYKDTFYEGVAAVTRNAYKGMITYIGSSIDDAMIDTIYRQAFTEAGIEMIEAPDQVEIVRRHGEKRDFLFLMNHDTKEARDVNLDGTYKVLTDEETYRGTVRLAPLETLILTT